MGRWSGRGIPPTRRKLHAWRRKQEAEAKSQRVGNRAEAKRIAAEGREVDAMLRGCNV